MPPVKRLTKGRFLRHPSLSEAHSQRIKRGSDIVQTIPGSSASRAGWLSSQAKPR
jgi:hypothetical protein